MNENGRRIRREDYLPPPESAGQPRSLLTVFLALVLGLALFAGLFFLMLPLGAIVLATGLIVLLLSGVTFAHYLVWGRWLGPMIRREVEEEDRRSEARHRALEQSTRTDPAGHDPHQD